MSKKAKKEAAEKRLRHKRAQKAARTAQYEAWKALGQNKKSKRFRQHSKGQNRLSRRRVTITLVSLSLPSPYFILKKVHGGDENCGNIGCLKCSALARKAYK